MSDDRDLHGFSTHVEECGECQSHRDTLARAAALLASSQVPVDAEQLSQRAMFWLQPALDGNAADAMWRRALTALTLAVAPLPLVLVWDSYLLRLGYAVLQSIMPGTFATYVLVSYSALLTLLFAATYAAIPIALGRHRPPLMLKSG